MPERTDQDRDKALIDRLQNEAAEVLKARFDFDSVMVRKAVQDRPQQRSPAAKTSSQRR
jgi:hypothetical protein